ncbi:ogr/Delta-like zinc finger family protein [Symbiopectobacterium sp. RP]|uniref:ogr/Delta-like zinc finger family protein n=1 Tax=Symbiopectobacterium sp. RP TaxID=3248553 RepID=UPI003D2D5C6E
MFRCPLCGASGRTRTSTKMNDTNTVRRKYYQCNNLACGVCFTTMEAFEKFTSKQNSGEGPLSDDFIPRDAFPASHYGRDQLYLVLVDDSDESQV